MAIDRKAAATAIDAFLRAIGVPAEVAEVDAEGIEHHVSAETLEAFRLFTERMG